MLGQTGLIQTLRVILILLMISSLAMLTWKMQSNEQASKDEGKRLEPKMFRKKNC